MKQTIYCLDRSETIALIYFSGVFTEFLQSCAAELNVKREHIGSPILMGPKILT